MENTAREHTKCRLPQPVHFKQEQTLVFVRDLAVLVDVFAGADEDAVDIAARDC